MIETHDEAPPQETSAEVKALSDYKKGDEVLYLSESDNTWQTATVVSYVSKSMKMEGMETPMKLKPFLAVTSQTEPQGLHDSMTLNIYNPERVKPKNG